MSGNIGRVDPAKSREMRDQMDDTFWFKAESGKGNTWGRNFLRILPPHASMDGTFYFGVPMHFRVGPGQQQLACPRRANLTNRCPICDFGFALRKEGKEEEFKQTMPTWQAYMNVIVLNEDGTPKETPPRVRTWSASKKVLDMLLDELESTGDFTDLEEGYDICVSRKGEMFATEYRIKLNPKGPTPVTYPEAVAELRDLRQISPFLSTEALQKALEAPVAGADPWAPSEKQVTAGATDPEVRTAAEAKSAWGDPEDDEGNGSAPEKGGRAADPPAAPSEDDRAAARERLKAAVAKPE